MKSTDQTAVFDHMMLSGISFNYTLDMVMCTKYGCCSGNSSSVITNQIAAFGHMMLSVMSFNSVLDMDHVYQGWMF